MQFEDGRQFTIAGTVLSDGATVIPFSAITLGAKPTTFPIAVTNVVTPAMFVELIILDVGTILAAMSVNEYNQLAIAQSTRTPSLRSQALGAAQTVAGAIARLCGSCGR